MTANLHDIQQSTAHVQRQPGASERDERCLEVAKYALFLDLNAMTNSSAVVPLIVPAPYDNAGRERVTHLDEVLGLVWVEFSCHGRAWRKRRMGIKQEVRERERSEVVFQREGVLF